jgi:putative endonuclease
MTVYILHSNALGRHYVGMTQDLVLRLRQHNSSRKNWTAQADDWRVVWSKEVANRDAARELERLIKGRGAVRWLAGQAL